jgi:hypothetical protein
MKMTVTWGDINSIAGISLMWRLAVNNRWINQFVIARWRTIFFNITWKTMNFSTILFYVYIPAILCRMTKWKWRLRGGILLPIYMVMFWQSGSYYWLYVWHGVIFLSQMAEKGYMFLLRTIFLNITWKTMNFSTILFYA